MISFSPDPCFAIDREGKVVAWNEAMEQTDRYDGRRYDGKR